MSEDEATFQIFNLETMSGVHPGKRTAVMQHIRLLPLSGNNQPPRWARLLWYLEPPSCDLHLQAETPESWHDTPLLRLENPFAEKWAAVLRQALATAGWRAFTCGNCAQWQPLLDTANEDGIQLGRCGWKPVTAETLEMPERLRLQSLLALGCPAWVETQSDLPAVAALPDAGAVPQQESPPSRRWERFKSQILGVRPVTKHPSWTERIGERSGVGAGTEPCFACQGRMANLGALVVATDEGDKRTFSVWRCRRCHTFYLNDWTDRWERLDSLETEEIYYRLAPVEAVELLALFEGVVGGEHPARRHHRHEQRTRLETFIRHRPRLSQQIRQGR